MSATNGAAGPRILSLGACTAQTRPVEIEREGQAVTLQGWAQDDGCLVSVLAEIAAAQDRWRTAGTDEAYLTYLREMVQIAVPALTLEEAEVIAGNHDKRRRLLEYLDWWAASAEDVDDPEADGGGDQPTTVASSPASAPSTASRRSRSST
jgi:hypothetical protein